MPHLVLVPGGAVILGSYAWLRRGGFPAGLATLLAVLVCAQAGIVLAFASAGHSLWLALALGGVAASASAFAEYEDARRIILLGCALAAVQVADPMGGLLAAGIVPAAVAIRREPTDAGGTVGLYALLLFLPVATAVVLLYATRVLHVEAMALIGGTAPATGPYALAGRLTLAAAPVLVALPLLVAVRRTAGGRAICLVAAVTLASSAFGALMGAVRDPVTLMAAGAPLCIGAVASLPVTPGRFRRAMGLAATCTALSWLALALAGA